MTMTGGTLPPTLDSPSPSLRSDERTLPNITCYTDSRYAPLSGTALHRESSAALTHQSMPIPWRKNEGCNGNLHVACTSSQIRDRRHCETV